MKIYLRHMFQAVPSAILLFVALVPANSQVPKQGNTLGNGASDSQLTVPEIRKRLKSEGLDAQKRSELLQLLRRHSIRTPEDLDAIIEAAKDKDASIAALSALENIDSLADVNIRKKFVSLIDVDDDSADLRVIRTILKTGVKHRTPEVTSKIRERIEREPKTKIKGSADRSGWWRDNWKTGKRVGLIQSLAQALADSGDKGSLEKLFELDEVLATDQAASILTKYGREALILAANKYEKEEGLRKEGCLSVVAQSTSSDSWPELKRLIRSNNSRLRHAALNALVLANAEGVDELLEAAKADQDDVIRKYARNQLFRRNPAKNKAEIERLMWSKDSREQLAVLQMLSANPPKGMEDTLERFIREDEATNPKNPMMRFYAAKALWKLTGRKIEYSRGTATYKPYPWDDPSQN